MFWGERQVAGVPMAHGEGDCIGVGKGFSNLSSSLFVLEVILDTSPTDLFISSLGEDGIGDKR